MAGIMHEIEETLHMGGQKKEEEKHKGEGHHGHEEHKVDEADHGDQQHKEGIMDKIKDKIPGNHAHDGEKKKEKKKKKLMRMGKGVLAEEAYEDGEKKKKKKKKLMRIGKGLLTAAVVIYHLIEIPLELIGAV